MALFGRLPSGKYRELYVDDEGRLQVVTHSDEGGSSIAFAKHDVAVTTGYVLIDLSDVDHYPHHETGSLGIDFIIIAGLADVTAVGYYDIGFITRIDNTDADFYSIFHGHFDKKEERFEIMLNFNPLHIILTTNDHLSGGEMKVENDVTFQSDATVEGTYDLTTTPAVGDLILKVTRTAGTASIAVLVGYHSHE